MMTAFSTLNSSNATGSFHLAEAQPYVDGGFGPQYVIDVSFDVGACP